jgi:probable rRNA maturation factor
MKKNSLKRTDSPRAEPRRVIDIRREKRLAQKVSPAAVRRAIRRTLQEQSYRKPCSVSVLLASEETLGSLNARFRGVARPTDVLAFGSRRLDPETGVVHLGEIAISLPRAAAQARSRRVPMEREVQLLAVHGTLHLLGLDHDLPVRKKRMWRAQRKILRELLASDKP